MPANRRQSSTKATDHPPPSSTAKSTVKSSNKDASKPITVPQAELACDSSSASPLSTTTASAVQNGSRATHAANNGTIQPVNRKKQKRRAKAAAKAAAEQALRDQASSHAQPSLSQSDTPPSADSNPQTTSAEADLTDEEGEISCGLQVHSNHTPIANPNGASPRPAKSGKKSKKANKNKARPSLISESPTRTSSNSGHTDTAPPRRSGLNKEKIWNTSSQEIERERIKDFWLGLGEEERKSLVKVEKDAVLKKMKEQQKQTCSCTVCGRKRTAIEEELEGLYDAYYLELEQFANHPHHQAPPPPMMGPSRRFAPAVNALPPSRCVPSNYASQQPSRGRIVEHVGEDDEDEVEDNEYTEDEEEEIEEEEELDEDEFSDEEPAEPIHPADYATGFFNFGNSLTVQGGILTVADDLLKNDGKKFIEMMEQLAQRRMNRESDAKDEFARPYEDTNGVGYANNHMLPPEQEEAYDSQEDDESEEEEEEYAQEDEGTMNDEQRMEEGRRMFQIFAARMFEQRVLTAYREKVAKERQQTLIEELEEEGRQDSQRKAKKAKEAQKRKDRAQKKKEAQAEERARKEAEKAAEEKARLAEEARRAEEVRRKAEEKRKKKEVQRKAEEEERLRKEAERQQRLHEQKERQAEQERRAREAKEREKKAKEEVRLKEKEAREHKEREARERKEREAREHREREARQRQEQEARERERKEQQDCERREKKAREAKAQAEREAREKQKQEERAAQKAAALSTAMPVNLPRRPSQQQQQQQQHHPKQPQPQAQSQPQQQHSQHQSGPGSDASATPQPPATRVASPQLPVAAPALPKAPTPMRPRQPSRKDYSVGSAHSAMQSTPAASQTNSPLPLTPIRTSPGPMFPLGGGGGKRESISTQGTMHPQSASQVTSPHQVSQTLPIHTSPFNMPPIGAGLSYPPGLPQVPPGFGNRVMQEPLFNPMGASFRSGGMPLPPGLHDSASGRGFPQPTPPPGFSLAAGDGSRAMSGSMASAFPAPSLSKDSQSGPPHSRQPSAGFESGLASSLAQASNRPAPIGRPGSVVPGQRTASGSTVSGLAASGSGPDEHHLGSSALLDDPEEALGSMGDAPTGNVASRRGTVSAGSRTTTMFSPGSLSGTDHVFQSPLNPWAPSTPVQNPFGATPPPPPPPPPPGFSSNAMPVSWGPPAPASAAFGGQLPGARPGQPRSMAIRQMLCRACKELAPDYEASRSDLRDGSPRGYIPLAIIKQKVDQLSQGESVTLTELLDMCDTEGNPQNGGGSFDVQRDMSGNASIRWTSGDPASEHLGLKRAVGTGPGDIGSPIVGAGLIGSNR